MAAKWVVVYRLVTSRASDVIRAFDWPAHFDELVNPTECGVENQRAATVSTYIIEIQIVITADM